MGSVEKTGVIVLDVAKGSAADEAGIEPGDIIKEVNRRPVRKLDEYRASVAKAGKGATVLILVKRGSTTFYVSLQ